MYTRLDPQRSRASESIALDIIDGRPWIASRIRNNNLKQHCHLLGRTFRSSHRLTDPLRPAARRLFAIIGSRTRLLTEVHPSRMQLVPGLVRVAAYSSRWLRDPENWQPDGTETPARQWRSLIAHLFEAWPVPDVFANAWWTKETLVHPERDWYCHMAAGGNLRHAPGMPETITARECHFATQAPSHLGIRHALLWARVRIFGGSVALWEETLAGPMMRHFSMDAVWSRLLAKLAAAPEVDPRELGLIADTLVVLRHQADGRYVLRLASLPLAELRAFAWRFWITRLQVAEKSGLRFAARDVASSGLRQVLRQIALADWEPMERIVPCKNLELPDQFRGWRWQVEEVCNHAGLLAEGMAMRHCVAFYRQRCRKGDSCIFSLSREHIKHGSYPDHRLTIEVSREGRHIRQVRGRYNRRPWESNATSSPIGPSSMASPIGNKKGRA